MRLCAPTSLDTCRPGGLLGPSASDYGECELVLAKTEDLSAEIVPRVSRRHATGVDSARAVLFTLLGEFVLPGGGSAWTSAIIDVLARLSVEQKAARQALMRTAADGWLVSERVGRRTLWHLTDSATQLLTEGTERIYSFSGRRASWDGQWVIVIARVPETDRPARHLVRTRLSWAGFGSPVPGVWISAHSDRTSEAERVLDKAGVLADARIFVGDYTGGGELAAMVAQAWDLTGLDNQYCEFMTRFRSLGNDDPVARQIDLVHSWRRFPWIDPALPAELLPPRWSGGRAAQLFARLHSRWATAAMATWDGLNSSASSVA